jgi:predicted enzyme involved in methoxymalonyl-ACP biosynthesis
MKNVLANIGEAELSGFAYKLEQAGMAKDLKVIAGETPLFIEELTALTAKLKQTESAAPDVPVSITAEDALYLNEKLSGFITACDMLNIRAAKTFLNDIKQKTWLRETDEAINEISVNLLRGEYNKAASAAEKLLK